MLSGFSCRLLSALFVLGILISFSHCENVRNPALMAAIDPAHLSVLSSSHLSDHPLLSPAPSPVHKSSILLSRCTKSIVFVPSFQGTVLHHCKKTSCHPLHLTPQSPHSYPRLYAALASTSTKLLSKLNHLVEYPSYTCPPSPFSHATHCNPLPGRGPVYDLRQRLSVAGHSDSLPPSFKVIPYDWRQSPEALLSPSNPFLSKLTNILRPNASASVVLAHGTACSLFLSAVRLHPFLRPAACVCLAPPTSAAATDALLHGNGILLSGQLHTHTHPVAGGLAPSSRLSFRLVAHQLGLASVSRRNKVPFSQRGQWQHLGPVNVASAKLRAQLASTFPSLQHMSKAAPPPRIPGLQLVCVEALRERTELGGRSACSPYHSSRVVQVNSSAMDLSAMVAAVGSNLLQCPG